MLLFPNNDWLTALQPIFKKKETFELFNRIDALYAKEQVLPEENHVFKAFEMTPYIKTRVVIIGQDPYPTPGDAVGMSFSVEPQRRIPKSLQNIFIERRNDLGIPLSQNGDLSYWAKQGVLLLNANLTVNAGSPGSHHNEGWEIFTNGVIDILNQKDTPIVYILWGAFARSYKQKINTQKDYIIESPHPSPLSAYRGFFGSKPFSRTNKILTQLNLPPIDWRN
jgi:uracil-DNA glycosylase